MFDNLVLESFGIEGGRLFQATGPGKACSQLLVVEAAERLKSCTVLNKTTVRFSGFYVT